MQLEDRQMIRRFLERHFSYGRPLFPFAIPWTTLVSEDGPDGLEVQRRAAAVNQRLKHLLYVSADFENQIPAVLDLIVRVLITKPALPLLLQVEGKAQADGINPTLADLVQPPYSPGLGQGVCDLRQACGVGDMSKTVSFFSKADSCLTCLSNGLDRVTQPIGEPPKKQRRLENCISVAQSSDGLRKIQFFNTVYSGAAKCKFFHT
jgi:hypothetical protein